MFPVLDVHPTPVCFCLTGRAGTYSGVLLAWDIGLSFLTKACGRAHLGDPVFQVVAQAQVPHQLASLGLLFRAAWAGDLSPFELPLSLP